MAAIPPTYASPGLRWGLCLEDHPEAFVEFKVATGTELGIPDFVGGGDGENFCVATVTFPPETKKPQVIGYKHIPTGRDLKAPGTPKGEEEHLSDAWNILCTKALGRALKRAGYPDDIPDLKALTVWRMRSAQIEALTLGNANFTMGLADAEKAIDEAGKVDAGPTGDDGATPNTEREALPAAEPPTAESTEAIRQLINELGPLSVQLRDWAKDQGYQYSRPASEAIAQAILAEGRAILARGGAVEAQEAPPAPTGADTPPEPPKAPPGTDTEVHGADEIDQLRELLDGLDETERKGWERWAVETMGVDPASDPESWGPESRAEALAWLEVG